ncbi:hypothetical protein [Priestia megaterium]|uniref:hypothetical protein n=1 Tax=Priestia megaterium TaxID=1404 RepID=UPI002E1B7F28|nr:hypothetical protein [Priestia megaterium]
MLLMGISVIDVIVAVLSSGFSKVQFLKGGGMSMLRRNVERVKLVLDNWVVKAFLLILGVWFASPQP